MGIGRIASAGRSRPQHGHEARRAVDHPKLGSPARVPLESVRREILLEARLAPPVDIASELTPGRRDGKLGARRVQPRQLQRMAERPIAEFGPAFFIVIDEGVGETEEPQLREASVRPGPLQVVGMLAVHLG